MKMRHQEYIRTVELLLGCVAIIASKNFTDADISSLATLPFFMDTLMSQRGALLTKDYKELSDMYNQVIDNFSKLMKEFGKDDVIEIFAIYIYMYRKGYLSYNHYFEYNTKMKDLPKLMGIDVIRGSGVCRSIASMLSDIYNNMNMPSDTLIVHTTKDTIDSLEKLSIASINKSLNGKKFAKVVGDVTDYIKVPNHLVTAVKDNKKTYILDPTNDGILYRRGKNNFYPYDNNINSMNYNKLISCFQRFIGMYHKGKIKDINSSKSINQQEYYDKYLATINFINNNVDYFDYFYHNNFDIYKKIYSVSEDTNSLVKRIMPIALKR